MIAGNRLGGKVALVTGGARGMGAAHVRAMAAEGASVMIADILDTEGHALASELGPSTAFTHLDVTDAAQWADAVAATVARFGGLSVLVNNAGIVNMGPIGSYSARQWDAVIAVDLTGAFLGITAAAPALRASAPSSIINISSTAGLQGTAELHGYTAAKWGLRGLTKSVALELGADGVRVNSVHPGVIHTPMIADLDVSALGGGALGRGATPDEVSPLVVFLAADESSFCTASEFVVDGGITAGSPPFTEQEQQ